MLHWKAIARGRIPLARPGPHCAAALSTNPDRSLGRLLAQWHPIPKHGRRTCLCSTVAGMKTATALRYLRCVRSRRPGFREECYTALRCGTVRPETLCRQKSQNQRVHLMSLCLSMNSSTHTRTHRDTLLQIRDPISTSFSPALEGSAYS